MLLISSNLKHNNKETNSICFVSLDLDWLSIPTWDNYIPFFGNLGRNYLSWCPFVFGSCIWHSSIHHMNCSAENVGLQEKQNNKANKQKEVARQKENNPWVLNDLKTTDSNSFQHPVLLVFIRDSCINIFFLYCLNYFRLFFVIWTKVTISYHWKYWLPTQTTKQ